MDNRPGIEESDKRSKAATKNQIAFTESELEREHQLIFLDAFASLLFLGGAILLIVFKKNLPIYEFIWWMGVISAFGLFIFFAYLSFSHIGKAKGKKVLIEKLEKTLEEL